MKNNLNILAYCSIKENNLSLNGNSHFSENEALDFGAFSKAAYHALDMKYGKFFKMDNLSKLAILTSELLCKSLSNKEETAIVLSNKSASLETDRKHQETISDPENYYPSPAIFVYTLPNITIGEISIKHQIKGENAFFVSEKFNAKLLLEYTTSLIQNKKGSQALCGWVEYDHDQYNAFMYIVAEDGAYEYSEDFINKLYNK